MKSRMSFYTLIILLMGACLLQSVHASERIKAGVVVARSVVLDKETGQPILVEFNEDGSEGDVISVPAAYSTRISELTIMAAAEYEQHKQRLIQYKSLHADGLAKGAKLMTAQAFSTSTYKAADNKTSIPAPSLNSNVKSVLVRGQSDRILPNSEELVLLSFPVNLTELVVTEGYRSLVLSPEGNVLAQSSKNIAYRVGFYGKSDEAQPFYGPYKRDSDDEIFGPVKGVKVSVDEVYPGGVSVTDDNGKYSFIYRLPTCPLGGFEFTTDIWVQLSYKSFMPTGSPSLPYVIRKQDWDYCYAYLKSVHGFGGFYEEAPVDSFNITKDVYVDVMFLTGRTGMRNLDGSAVAVAEFTTYKAFSEEESINESSFQYDFNNDGVNDTVVFGKHKIILDAYNEEQQIFVAKGSEYWLETDEVELQGVYFNPANAGSFNPDLVRVVDTKKRLESTGNLETISTEDYQNTDILVFRESTGQLVVERRGVRDEEISNRTQAVYDEDNQQFAYRIMLRGPRDTDLNIGGGDRSGGYSAFASRHRMAEPFQKREADHLKAGETVKIVAINRATGYIGTARAQLTSAAESPTSRLNVAIDDIIMRPPNLKIWAERESKIESGLDAGESRRNLIGAEGAGLSSDTTITIFSEWLDHDGSALPDGLGVDSGEQYGMTGRLAKIVSNNQLGGGSQLAEFPVAPGRKVQAIKIKSNLASAEHYYVHVVGTQKDENPSFSTGTAPAPYDTRPALLTPFLTPLYNEGLSWLRYTEYLGLNRDYQNNGQNGFEPHKPLPDYGWLYRPEYQFSQIKLEIDAITKTTFVGNSNAQTEDVLGAGYSTINTTDDLVSIFYSLIQSQYDRLSPIDGPQEFILAFGADETRVQVGANGSATFDNLEKLGNLTAEDWLSIRLYTNNDAGNVLWQHSFDLPMIAWPRVLNNASSEYKRKVRVDAPNNWVCPGPSNFSFRLNKPALVTLKIGSQTLLANQPTGKGWTKTDIPIMAMGIHEYELTAINPDTGGNESIKGNYYVEYAVTDALPLGHTIEENVDLYNGNLSLSATDVAITSRGNQLTLARSYSSSNKDRGLLGYGWSHNFEAKITELGCGAYQVGTGSGGAKFFQDGDGFRPARGYHSTLERDGNTFYFYSKDGHQYRFDNNLFNAPPGNNWYLAAITDTNGNKLTYSYDKKAEEPLLSRVEDDQGRALTFTYKDFNVAVPKRINALSKLLVAVQGPATSITYEYSDTGKLIQATVNGATSRYEYAEVPSLDTLEDLAEQPVLVSMFDANNAQTRYEYHVAPLFTETQDAAISIPNVFYDVVHHPVSSATVFTYGDRTTPSATELKTTVANPRGLNGEYTLNTYGATVKILRDNGNVTQTWKLDQVVMASRTDERGITTAYEYDANGNTIKETVAGQPPLTRTYVVVGKILNLLKTQTDRNGNTTTHFYDERGNRERTEFPNNTTVKMAYHSNGDLITRWDQKNQATHFIFDAWGYPKTVIRPDTGPVNLTYDERGLKRSETDGLNNKTTYRYDVQGFLTDVTYPIGSVRFTYDANGNKLTSRDQEGRVTAWEYDLENRVVLETNPITSREFTYNEAANLVSETDWLGNLSNYEYNSVHQRIQEARPLGLVSTFSYDPVGNLLRSDAPLGRFQAFTYDDLNRPLTQEDRSGVVTFGYDGNGNTISVTDQLARVTQYDYDKLNRLVRTVEPLSRITKIEYDGNGNRKVDTDPNGNTTTYTYDGANRVLTQAQPDSFTNRTAVTQYTYDFAGNLVQQTDAEMRVTGYSYDNLNRRKQLTNGSYIEDYVYDQVGNLLSTSTPANLVETEYDALNRVLERKDNLGTLARFSYDANGNVKTETDGRGLQSTHDYNALNYKTHSLLAGGRDLTFSPDVFGNVTELNDANGIAFLYSFDANNRLVEETHPNGVVKYGYDLVGNRTSVIDKRAVETRYSYDDLNRLIKTTDSYDQSLVIGYDANGNAVVNVDKRKISTQNTYNSYNQLVQVSRANLTLVRNEYDLVGNLIAVTDANDNRTEFDYNHLNLQTASRAPLETNSTQAYNAAGQLLSSTDAENRLTQFTPDARGQVRSQNTVGLITTFAYDGNGNVIEKRKPAGNTWAYSYDDANRLATVTSPTGSTRYGYDGNGNRTDQWDALNQLTQYGFDANNLLTSVTYPGGDVATYGYDVNGNRTSAVYPNLTNLAADYDNLNRLTEQRYSDGNRLIFQYDENNNLLLTETYVNAVLSAQATYTYDAFDRNLTVLDQFGVQIAYQYDANGNRTQVSQGGVSTQYGFDALNRLAQLTDEQGSTLYSYDKTGLPVAQLQPGGLIVGYGYDNKGRLESQRNLHNSLLLSSYDYSYDDNGNRLSQVEENGGAAETTSYSYDSEDRLTQVVYPATRVDYSYDVNFNRLTETETQLADNQVSKDWLYSYDQRNQLTTIADQLNSANNISYSYDEKGNQLSKTKAGVVTEFTYNARDQLLSVTEAGQSQGEYRYNHLGMRIEKLGERGVERSSYDGKSLLVQRDGADQLLAQFRYGAGRLHSLDTGAAEPEYYLFDGLGSAVTTAQANGNVISRNQFDAWGNKRAESGSSWNRFGFTGHEHDEETGLIYAKARFYDPDTGRFLSHDPWEGDVMVAPSLHKYLYAYGNPTYYIDPDGNESVSTMLTNAELNADSAMGAFGYRFLSNLYHAGTLGFASIHDPAKDAYDSGRITGKQYAAAGTAALIAPAVVIGTGGTASGFVAAATTTTTRIGATALVGAAYGGGLDAYTQGSLIATDVQENYSLKQTATATATGAVLAPLAVEGSLAATRTVESVLASRAASRNNPRVSVEDPSGPSTQTTNSSRSVEAYESDSFAALKRREVVGDELEHNHIPSAASRIKAIELELGAELTAAQRRQIYNEASALEEPKSVHRAGPTYGGRNTPAQIAHDARNPAVAACRDCAATRRLASERGDDLSKVDEGVNQLHERNIEQRVYTREELEAAQRNSGQ